MSSRLSHTWLPVVKTSAPRSNRSSASCGVIPKPPAAFSALMTTRSTSCALRTWPMCSRTILRPALPKMSPTKRMFKLGSSSCEDRGQRSETTETLPNPVYCLSDGLRFPVNYLANAGRCPWFPTLATEMSRKDGAPSVSPDPCSLLLAFCSLFPIPCSLFLRPHQRKQNHIADGLRAGQQHDQAVDADALAACGRQPVGQRPHVVGVHLMGLVVAALALGKLLDKSLVLLDRVVQHKRFVQQLKIG